MSAGPLDRLLSLRLHQAQGRRSPHKPLLALLALARLHATGSSALPWSVAEQQLASLITDFGPASTTGRAQSAAYPFTRLRSDGVWHLDSDVPMDDVGPLRAAEAVGCFAPDVEADLLASHDRLLSTARALVASHFPESLVPDVLSAAGLDPELVLVGPAVLPWAPVRKRSAAWRSAVLDAWDCRCAFCGYDGQLGSSPVGLEAAHVRWFTFDGPDAPDNGLALCALHHKLFDRGALGLDAGLRVLVSSSFTARADTGRTVYDLHGRPLMARPGTQLPAQEHVAWHAREVFKGLALAA